MVYRSNSVSFLFLLSVCAWNIIGCAKKLEVEEQTSAVASVTATESAYCGTPTAVSGSSISITGTANFKYRTTVYNGSSGYLSWNTGTAEIAFAEVHIYNSKGERVQCGETDTNGNFSISIPKTDGDYVLKVLSRSFNNKYKVSVLEDLTNKTPYSIVKSFAISSSSSSTQNIGTLTAEANESTSTKIEGGAFNILYNILIANEFIRTKISNTSWVADKVTVYWKAGFNPYSYFGAPSSLVSFYIAGNRELYILGGKDGNVKTADTDHFDDSVILHEYGHFLEDVYAKSDSPGGSHNGNSIIDPRLAWSEGWANYFQSAVKYGANPSDTLAPYYIDTIGYRSSAGDTSAGIGIAFNMTEVGGSASMDRPTSAGEGTYREVSIARTLYKTHLPTATNYSTGKPGGGIPFSDIWTAFSSATQGLKSSAEAFRSVGMFNEFLNSLASVSKTNWNLILSEEMQNKTRADYGDVLQPVATNGCNSLMMTPVQDSSGSAGTCSNGVVVYANRSQLQKSNHFYALYYDGSNYSIQLSYTTTGTSSTKADLDLILYKQSYVYFEDYLQYGCGLNSSSIAVQSRNVIGSGTSETETINLTGLSAGWYLLNIKARTYNKLGFEFGGTATYTLSKSSGGDLCPNTKKP